MDAPEPDPEPFPPAPGSPAWSHGWTFRISSEDAARPRVDDPDAIAAAREAARAMQDALLEARARSLLVDAAVAPLVAPGATSAQVAGDVGLSARTADDLVAGMPMLESVCRDGVAHFEGRARWQQAD